MDLWAWNCFPRRMTGAQSRAEVAKVCLDCPLCLGLFAVGCWMRAPRNVPNGCCKDVYSAVIGLISDLRIERM